MPIVVDRKTGKILSKPQYTPEQIFAAQAAVVKAWAKKHPDVLASQETMEEWLRQRRGITVDSTLNGKTKSADR